VKIFPGLLENLRNLLEAAQERGQALLQRGKILHDKRHNPTENFFDIKVGIAAVGFDNFMLPDYCFQVVMEELMINLCLSGKVLQFSFFELPVVIKKFVMGFCKCLFAQIREFRVPLVHAHMSSSHRPDFHEIVDYFIA